MTTDYQALKEEIYKGFHSDDENVITASKIVLNALCLLTDEALTDLEKAREGLEITNESYIAAEKKIEELEKRLELLEEVYDHAVAWSHNQYDHDLMDDLVDAVEAAKVPNGKRRN